MAESRRIKCIVSYEGTAYNGWAFQSGANTIEGQLMDAIFALTGERVSIIGASRTDAGVHALCNIAVFDTCSSIPGEKFAYALNTHLPEDIRIVKSLEVAMDYHPRHQKSSKTYVYRIYNAPILNPAYRNYAHFLYGTLQIGAMKEAAAHLVGTHDFASFCNPATSAISTVREIYSIDISVKEIYSPSIVDAEPPHLIEITVCGGGFLYNMVRIIAGTLIDVGFGRTSPEDIPQILAAHDRGAAGPTAPANGLMLTNMTETWDGLVKNQPSLEKAPVENALKEQQKPIFSILIRNIVLLFLLLIVCSIISRCCLSGETLTESQNTTSVITAAPSSEAPSAD